MCYNTWQSQFTASTYLHMPTLLPTRTAFLPACGFHMLTWKTKSQVTVPKEGKKADTVASSFRSDQVAEVNVKGGKQDDNVKEKRKRKRGKRLRRHEEGAEKKRRRIREGKNNRKERRWEKGQKSERKGERKYNREMRKETERRELGEKGEKELLTCCSQSLAGG